MKPYIQRELLSIDPYGKKTLAIVKVLFKRNKNQYINLKLSFIFNMTIMKILKIPFVFALILICSSFKDKPAIILLNGVYGTCNCSEDSNAENKYALVLKEDKTFIYNDVNESGDLKEIKGTWTNQNSKVYLSSGNNDLSIPDKWEIDKNGKCIKGRKGLSFVRLCHIKSCMETMTIEN